jgi:hypothetical protein
MLSGGVAASPRPRTRRTVSAAAAPTSAVSIRNHDGVAPLSLPSAAATLFCSALYVARSVNRSLSLSLRRRLSHNR